MYIVHTCVCVGSNGQMRGRYLTCPPMARAAFHVGASKRYRWRPIRSIISRIATVLAVPTVTVMMSRRGPRLLSTVKPAPDLSPSRRGDGRQTQPELVRRS